jgi:hypothetical protein
MEDITLAIVTLTSFVLLFVVAIFADRAGAELELEPAVPSEPVAVAVHEPVRHMPDADVA